MSRFIFFVLFFSIPTFSAYSQDIGFGNLLFDDFLRRKEIGGAYSKNLGFMLRHTNGSPQFLFFPTDSLKDKNDLFEFEFLPINYSLKLDSKRPYVGGEYGIIPARGLQTSFSSGFLAKFSILHFQFQPEIILAQNLSFQGFPSNFSPVEVRNRFLYWNVGDTPERFGNNAYTNFFLGQTSISLKASSFELGVGTKNFWWGPGQWNSLIFSNNAPGFPYISLNSFKPIKTFVGNIETQLLIGRLESSNQNPSQNQDLNSVYFDSLSSDWRYLNAIMLSYSPKWIPSITFGFARTYQYYNSDRPNDLTGWLPIFEPMAKEKFLVNGNAVVYDGRRQSQQIAIFSRYKLNDAKMDIYFQFGRRDHALNWREFILNPEHARAYQFGFIKLVNVSHSSKLLQIRGEITHQQESVNRNLRYDLEGGISWHTHVQVRGFTNFGQPMGVGIGTGSNVQTLELSFVEDWEKFGVLFERLENNQDFYYRTFGQQDERKPWIDWSAVLLWNTSYKNLFISARLQGTFANNYQWGLSQTSIPEFPVSQNLFSVHSQVNLIYFWNRSFAKKVIR
jgi:hypothetical protein